MKNATKMLLKIAVPALAAGVFLRYVSSDDEESRLVKTVVSATVTFAFGVVGGLVLLTGPIGALMLAGAAAAAVVFLGIGKGSFDRPAKDGIEVTREGASAASQRADELRERAEAARQSADVTVESETTVPPESQAPGVSEPIEADD